MASKDGMATKILGLTTLLLAGAVIALSIAIAAKSDKKEVTSTSLESRGPPPGGDNPCDGKDVGFPKLQCYIDAIAGTVNDKFVLGTPEQAGANVTKGYNGSLEVTTTPITNPYYMEGMCPVNVHWHLGAEHYSAGEYDDNGKGPSDDYDRRMLASEYTRAGFRCHHYDEENPVFTTEYEWKHCVNMHVGETYEVHWPHSNVGACATIDQFQTPFYDGVFCKFTDVPSLKVGVQGQVYTVVNDENYFYPDLLHGMIVDGDRGSDLAMYTGSTTGQSVNNTLCSQYTGITWQVDRKCHLISASSFDKLCADMKSQRDDMSEDLYPHGSRELVSDELAANNHANRFLRN